MSDFCAYENEHHRVDRFEHYRPHLKSASRPVRALCPSVYVQRYTHRHNQGRRARPAPASEENWVDHRPPPSGAHLPPLFYSPHLYLSAPPPTSHYGADDTSTGVAQSTPAARAHFTCEPAVCLPVCPCVCLSETDTEESHLLIIIITVTRPPRQSSRQAKGGSVGLWCKMSTAAGRSVGAESS